MDGANVILTSVFVAFESAFSYSAFLPSIMTIGTFVDSERKVVMIRQGEVIATGLSLGVALICAKILGSILPVVMMAFAALVMVAVYEWALTGAPARNGHSEEIA